MRKRTVIVNDKMQKGYRYQLIEPAGRDFDPEFRPELTPKEMLRARRVRRQVHDRRREEFPASWFEARGSPLAGAICALNYFGVDASQPLSVWRDKGWIHPEDPRGWFQWYCRYYLGRRMPEEDRRQIGRWKAMRRQSADQTRLRAWRLALPATPATSTAALGI